MKKRIRWERFGVLDGEERDDRARECHPLPRWRCRVWTSIVRVGDHPSPVPVRVWHWEARRFGRSHLHVSGEARTETLCRTIALAAVAAIAKVRR